MFSSKLLLAAEVLAYVPAVQANHASAYSVGTFSDAACTVPTEETKEAHDYEVHQVDSDKHCYAHKGYSLKLLCDHDDTVKVDHWFDISGKSVPCTGEALGQPLLEDVPWELAVGFLKGECTWNSRHSVYGKLSAALPLDGYPTCDLTGASIRRLSSNSTNSSSTNSSQTPPATPTPTLAPLVSPPAAANGSATNNSATNNGATNNSTTNNSVTNNSVTTAAPVTADSGVASGASNLCVASVVAVAAAVAVFTNIEV